MRNSTPFLVLPLLVTVHLSSSLCQICQGALGRAAVSAEEGYGGQRYRVRLRAIDSVLFSSLVTGSATRSSLIPQS